MSTPIEFTDGRLWKLLCIQGQVRKRYHSIITAVVKKY